MFKSLQCMPAILFEGNANIVVFMFENVHVETVDKNPVILDSITVVFIALYNVFNC